MRGETLLERDGRCWMRVFSARQVVPRGSVLHSLTSLLQQLRYWRWSVWTHFSLISRAEAGLRIHRNLGVEQKRNMSGGVPP